MFSSVHYRCNMLSDDHEGIKAAVSGELPSAEWQRCTVHFERNILAHVPTSSMAEVAQDIKAIFKVTACCSGSEPMRTWQHERLLSRPKTKDSLLGRRRHVKGPGCPHLLRGPLLGQALRREGRAGRAFGPEEASRLSPEAGREGHQALGGGFQ